MEKEDEKIKKTGSDGNAHHYCSRDWKYGSFSR